jgi:hypothetical protein
LTLRLVLAAFGLIVCIGAAIAFAVLDVPTVYVALAIVLAVVAAIDIVVVTRRKLHGEPG